MNEASKFAKNRLQDASRAKDHARQMALVLATLAGGIVILLGVALLDYWLILPVPARFGGVAVMLALACFGARRWWQARKRPTALKEVALDAESQKAGLGCELSTAAEYLSGERKVSLEYEADLAAALQEKAAKNLERVDLPYWKRPLQTGLALGLVAFALVLFGAMASGAFTALKRTALPWSNAAYTTVAVKPGDIEIPIGKDVEIKSVFSGRVPRRANLSWRDDGAATWQTVALTRTNTGEYLYAMKNVRTPVAYHVSGSDAISADFKVTPYIPPEVKDWRVELNYPAYTKHPRMLQTSPEISVVRGTTAGIVISPNVPLSKARIRFNGQPAIDLQTGSNGLWRADVKITKDTEFWVDLADLKGHPGTNDRPYHIQALVDTAPKVEITEPGQDIRSEATNTVPVKIMATDDFGISEMRLVYHRLGGPEQVITATRRGETNTELNVEIPLSTLNLKEHELVAYHAEATDNNTLDGPGVGKSEVFFIEITNDESKSSKGKGQPDSKVNLLVVQKQIIADTTALAANDGKEKFDDLAKRQKDAVEFGQIYLNAINQSFAAASASIEMLAAVNDMKKAQAALEQQARGKALPPEETALAHLYQVLKAMPELKDLPIAPP
ncbi:MAG TPA: DUF4175 family protein, partial [Verrucomicrobiae bacterium]|nr:DUF4175 family protein [Verrucomicrobiae bacterium]